MPTIEIRQNLARLLSSKCACSLNCICGDIGLFYFINLLIFLNENELKSRKIIGVYVRRQNNLEQEAQMHVQETKAKYTEKHRKFAYKTHRQKHRIFVE
jgi:hypothetical protein